LLVSGPPRGKSLLCPMGKNRGVYVTKERGKKISCAKEALRESGEIFPIRKKKKKEGGT